MKLLKFLPFTLLVFLFITSCRKEPIRSAPIDAAPLLTVLLDHNYLTASKVDSVVATWQVNGLTESSRMEIRQDSVVTDLRRFTAGTGKLTITIFSKLEFQQFQSQWVYEKEITVDGNKPLVQPGPKSFDDRLWSPRAMLKDAIGHFAVVALRPDDPYFLLRNVDPSVKKLVVARYYWKLGGGVSVVAGKEWECESNCIDQQKNVVDEQYFRSLPNQIGARAWNHIEIDILYIDQDWGGGYVLMLNHTLS